MNKYMRPWKARLSEEIEDRIECRRQPNFVIMQDICLTPLGQIYDESLRGRDDLIFEDTGFCAQISNDQGYDLSLEKAIYGGYIRKKWGHFITESIARMWALEEPETADFDKILFFSDSETQGIPDGNFLQIFELLGVADKIVIATGKVRVEQLLVPEIGYEHDRFFTEEQAGVYKRVIDNALRISPTDGLRETEKVFISRASIPGAVRDAINLKELEAYFCENGYEIIAPERTSLIDLIHIMDRANFIATLSGTPAHNYAFVNNPTSKRLLIIERHAWVNDFQVSINKMMGLKTVNVDAFYLPKAASSQDGLMMFAPTPQFCGFASDYGLSKEGSFVGDSRRQRIHELRRFMSRYRRYCCSGDALCEWEVGSGQPIAEAIVASGERYGEWLRQGLPVMWYDYLSPRPIARLLLNYLRKLK